MAQNVILQGHDVERSRSSVVKYFSISILPSTHKQTYTCEISWDLIASFSGMVEQSLTESQVARRSKKERRNIGETLGFKLTLCDANYAMKEQFDIKVTCTCFDDPFLSISCVSIHWAVTEIEPLKLCLKSAWIWYCKIRTESTTTKVDSVIIKWLKLVFIWCVPGDVCNVFSWEGEIVTRVMRVFLRRKREQSASMDADIRS